MSSRNNIFSKFGRIYIVAELSANHSNKLEVVLKTIDAAKASGADAIKIQTYTADTITVKNYSPEFRISGGTIWDGEFLYDLYDKAHTPWDWHKPIRDYCKKIGIDFFSTPFDYSAVEFLEKLNVNIYKISSYEITDLPLVEYIASKGKPVIISTGIASKEEIYDAINACKKVGNDNIILLKCTSEYPSKVSDANLITLQDMKASFGLNVGISDHTMGYIVPVTAVPYGISLIEKHFILDRKLGGPDSEFSMEPDEFKKMVENVRLAELSLGKISYDLDRIKISARFYSRSLYASKNIELGDLISLDNIQSRRPNIGIPAKELNNIIGARVNSRIKKGDPILWDSIVYEY